ncbi:MAG: MFS transporter [Chloroflexota bacterium]
MASKPKLYYGWYMVISGMFLSAYYSSILSYGWSAFVTPITATFGWSMAQVALAASFRGLEIGVFNPIWGPLVDRYPPKWLMRFGVTTTTLGLLCLSQTRNLPMYYGGFLIVGMGSSLIVGMLPLTVMARWFRKNIGKASGLFYMGAGLGGVAVPLIVMAIDKFGWRNTLLFAAAGFAIFGTAVSFIFRSRPQDYGMLPDGRTASDAPDKATGRVRTADFGVSVKDALRMRAFWHYSVVSIFQHACSGTVMFYAIPYFTQLGMTREIAGTVVSLYTFVSLFGRLPFGILSDHFRKKYVTALCVGLQLGGLVFYWLIGAGSPFWFILLLAVTYGLGISGVACLRGPLLSEYFGTKNFGAILGLTSMFVSVGGIVSQPLAGWIFDTYHDYKIWWFSLIIFGIVALIAILTMPRAPKLVEMGTAEAVKVQE